MAEHEPEAFRTSARDWLDENLPASLRGAPDAVSEAVSGAGPLPPDVALWKQRMADQGWGVPTWPREYGGAGLTPAQARMVVEEMGRLGAGNPIAGIGSAMLGPTLLESGTDDQKRRHLPPIARGELRWCEGYSEPGAGSDLASLQTRCEDHGDHWRVTGQKIWTSQAQFADWCFCLVRTDTTKKQGGISFVLIDMRQSGVEVRPIRLIDGRAPFCETFFTEARVEKTDMVGALNGGWDIGKRLLQHERGSQGGNRTAGVNRSLPELARDYIGADTRGRLADSDLRGRLAQHMIDAEAHALTIHRLAAERRAGGAMTSVMKISSTRIGQQRSELALEIMGSRGLGWEGDGFSAEELSAVQGWLWGKATTIAGGSFEIQNNVISKRILGLPEMLPSPSWGGTADAKHRQGGGV